MIESVELIAAEYEPTATQLLILTTKARLHYSHVIVSQVKLTIALVKMTQQQNQTQLMGNFKRQQKELLVHDLICHPGEIMTFIGHFYFYKTVHLMSICSLCMHKLFTLHCRFILLPIIIKE